MILTNEEREIVNQVIAIGGKIWENEMLDNIKKRIKTHFLGITTHQCCYCRRDMNDEFRMVIDIEHILPKSKFSVYMFEPFNLSVSCKRCNMKIKGEKIDFVIEPETILNDPQNSSRYLFIHPNLDDYFSNIDYIAFIRNNKKYIKYLHLTPKGEFTYSFFQLEKIEIATLNLAQGLKGYSSELSSHIPEDLRNLSENLLSSL